MSNCKLDHSHDDVLKKYQSQKEFLPSELAPLLDQFFLKNYEQSVLNEMFHLLKKYDLSSDDEKKQRDKHILTLLNNN